MGFALIVLWLLAPLMSRQLEESKFKAAEAEAIASKQRMLNIEKVKIRDLVRTAFAPLLAKIEA